MAICPKYKLTDHILPTASEFPEKCLGHFCEGGKGIFPDPKILPAFGWPWGIVLFGEQG